MSITKKINSSKLITKKNGETEETLVQGMTIKMMILNLKQVQCGKTESYE